MSLRTFIFIFFSVFILGLTLWSVKVQEQKGKADPFARCLSLGLENETCLCLQNKMEQKVSPELILKWRENIKENKDSSQDILNLFMSLKMECLKKKK